MSTIEDARTEPAPGSPADPFRYGWRYVAVKQPDGRVELEQVPLTLEDLLFPEEGDFDVQFPSHVNDCSYLKLVFETRLADDPEALVLFDCRVDYNIPGVRPLGPDIAVFLGVPSDWDRGTLKIAEDAAAPVLVVEVTSPDTRKNDFGIKKDFYHRAGVPLYVIVDARPGPKGRRVKLHGFRHTPDGYEPIPLDDQGRLWVEPLALWLAIADKRVVCIDGETREPIGGYGEQVQARLEAEARAEAEARSRIEWQARADALSRVADDAQARADALSRVADDAQARADALSRVADDAQARADAEARIRLLAEARAETDARARLEAEARTADAEARNRDFEARIQALEAALRQPRGEA